MKSQVAQYSNLPSRIRFCVDAFGKQKDFIERIDFSRAQLSRYMRGEISPPFSALKQVAQVSGINLGWLVTGEGAPSERELEAQVVFSDALLEKVIYTFESTLMEYRGVFTPTQKSILLPLIHKAMVHERLYSSRSDISKYEMHIVLAYMDSMVKNETLTVFRDAVYYLIAKDKGYNLPDKDLVPFSNVTCKAIAHYFNSAMGDNYFDRTMGVLNKVHQNITRTVMGHIFTILGNKSLKMVDLGCGSGRHLAYITEHYPQVEVNGIELSELPYRLCKERELSGNLPKGTVIRGDVRRLPYDSESMNFVLSIAVLHYLIHIPESSVGVNQVLQEVHRILKPGGLFYCDMRHGEGREYAPFVQQYTPEDVQIMAKNNGFDIVWLRTDSLGNLPELSRKDAEGPEKYKNFIATLLRKKAD